MIRAFAPRAVVAVETAALYLALAAGGIGPHARIVLHEAGIFACLRHTPSAVAAAFARVLVRVQLERILVEGREQVVARQRRRLDPADTGTVRVARVRPSVRKNTDAGDGWNRGHGCGGRCGGRGADTGGGGGCDDHRRVLPDTVALATALADAGVAAVLADAGAPRLVFGTLERGGPASGEEAIGDLEDTFRDGKFAGWIVEPGRKRLRAPFPTGVLARRSRRGRSAFRARRCG